MNKLFSKVLFGFFMFVGFLSISNVFAADADIDTGFAINSNTSFSTAIRAIQTDGKIIVGGSFTNIYGVPRNKIAKLNTDLSLDTSFNIGAGFDTGYAGSLVAAIQSDGKFIIGGSFTSYQGIQEKGLIRLNADGSKDTSFNIGSTITNVNVSRIILQSDGKIIIYGTFTYQGSTKNFIRFNSDGSIDTSFNMGNMSEVFDMAIDSNGKIIIAGGYSKILIRVNSDGSIDSSFNTGAGFNASVRAVLQQADGKLLVGGGFTTYQGVAASKIIRLNADGSRDTTFDIGAGITDGTDIAVAAMTFDQNGKILVTGYFKYYKGVAANSLMRLNTDGSRDTTFNIGTAFGTNYGPYINQIKIGNNNKIILAGSFSQYQDILSPTGLIVINSDGSRDETLANITNGFDRLVRAMDRQSDGKLLIGGFFKRFNKTNTPGLTRLNQNGTRDSSFDVGAGFNVGQYGSDYRSVSKIVVQPDQKILVIGSFTTYKGVSANKIIRLNPDGSRDTTFDIGVGFGTDYYSNPANISLQADGKILVNGSFTTYKGVAVSKWIRLNSDGSIDATFPNIGTGLSCSSAESCKIGPDGKMYGISGNNVIRLNTDGSVDTGRSVGAGFQYGANVIAIQPDGKILVGGNIYSYQGTPIYGIVRINTNGFRDTSFTATNVFDRNCGSQASKFLVQNDGKILVIGGSKLVRLNSNGSIDTSFLSESNGCSAGINFNGTVRDAYVGPKGDITVIGDFTNYRGTSADKIIRLQGTRDLTPPIPTITYSTSSATSGNVIATVTFNEPTTVTNNNGSGVYVFTGNGSFTFEFQDLAENVGSTTATVSWIDRTSPIGVISYSTTKKTDKNVIATLNVNEPYIMINNNGNNNYTFSENGDFTFYFKDLAGNIAFSTANVSRIDVMGSELLELIKTPQQLSGYWRKPWWISNFGNDCPSCTQR